MASKFNCDQQSTGRSDINARQQQQEPDLVYDEDDDDEVEERSRNIQSAAIKVSSSPVICLTGPPEVINNWSRFSDWVHCMCVVTFDLELGQAMEVIYPQQFSPSELEKTNICYLAFPDSNSGCMGDTQFHIRFRSSPDAARDPSTHLLKPAHHQFNMQCIPVQKVDISHYWGFVYFRQKKDPNLPRGYFQKSFIIITRLPFFNLFNEILSQIAPKYFRDGLTVLESVCEEISTRWPPLRAGESLNLPLFGTMYQTILPKLNSKKVVEPSQSKESNSNNFKNNDIAQSPNSKQCMLMQQPPKVIPSVHEIDLFRSLSCVITQIYTLWELVLTAEPIVVIGTSPADCSHMVQSLVALIAPLEFCAESRPYFTIHDSEFREFTRSGEYSCGQQLAAPPAIILGVTNPFFVKLLKDWPHMIRLVDNQMNVVQQHHHHLQNQQHHLSSNRPVTSPNRGLGSLRNTSKKSSTGLPASAIGSNSSSVSISNLSSISANEGNTPGLFTKYKPFLKKDKSLIKKIMLGIKTKRPEHVQSALLRRQLLELTQSFMIPLERYMASLMPLQKDISPFKSAPNPNQFIQEDFLATLEMSGPQLTSPLKGNWKGLYRSFFKSPNFKGWYESRHRELQQTLQDLQLQALSGADLNQWVQGKQEVEIIDMIIKIKQKLNLCPVADAGDHDSGCLPTDSVNCNSELLQYSAKDGSNKKVHTCSTSGTPSAMMPISTTSTSRTTSNINLTTRQQLLRQLENMKQSLPDDLQIILHHK